LPIGEEWEKAARGLLVEQTYPWGNNLPSCELGTLNGTNYSGCNSRDAFPVMSFAPNGYGLFDMSGNVSEWVDEGNKLIRGGSWNDNESRIKVFSTSEGETFDGYVNVGFRCARDAP
jgi:formylglycine-generating enzyme required for sulfatase activity